MLLPGALRAASPKLAMFSPNLAWPAPLHCAQVLENTSNHAVCRPDSAALSRPDFFESWGGMGLPVRMAARRDSCFQHPAHPLPLENGGDGCSQILITEPEDHERCSSRPPGRICADACTSSAKRSRPLLASRGALHRLARRACRPHQLAYRLAHVGRARGRAMKRLDDGDPSSPARLARAIDPEVIASQLQGELSISLWPRPGGGDGYQLIGTRQAIEASGLVFVRNEFAWPDADQCVSWAACGMTYRLRPVAGALWRLTCCADVTLSQHIGQLRKSDLPAAVAVANSSRAQAARALSDARFQRLLQRVLPPLHRIPRRYVV